MDVDFWGVVNGTKAFLPHLIDSGDGHVVNVSSLFGLFSVPGQAAYNSAKFAVRGFTEALRQEMALAKHPVKVTCVHPGGIKTAIARNADRRRGPRRGRDWPRPSTRSWPAPARKAPRRSSWRPSARTRRSVLVGPDAKILDVIVRITGVGYQQLFSTVVPGSHDWLREPLNASRPAGVRRERSRPPGPGSRAVGDLGAHLRQRGGVQHPGHLVDATSTCGSVSLLRR